MKISKKATFLWVINNPIIYKFFKDFTNYRKKTNRTVFLTFRAIRNIFLDNNNYILKFFP